MAIPREANDDAPSSVGTRYAMSVGDVFQGTVDSPDDPSRPGDRDPGDWIRIELDAGTTYAVRLDGVGVEGALDPYLETFDSDGNRVGDDDGVGLNARLQFTPAASGTCYIGARSSGNKGSGDYEVSVTTASPGIFLAGGAGDDTLRGATGDDSLTGGSGDDWMVGGKRDDTLDNGQGDDTLYGRTGDDRLDGGEGDDTLDGDSGDDTLRGGNGEDRLTGSRS